MGRKKRKRDGAIILTSPFRGVHWDWERQRYRAEIEVRNRRYKLGWHADDRDAALAYDAACETLGVPERRNFGAHPLYTEYQLLRSRTRECNHCRGLGMLGGEFNMKAGAGSHCRFIRLGPVRQCESCRGAGYIVLPGSEGEYERTNDASSQAQGPPENQVR
jgi:hypothetical protein